MATRRLSGIATSSSVPDNGGDHSGSGGGGAGGYVDDVFSTYVYTGTGADQDIENGIDLDGEGGLVWVKGRDQAFAHFLCDTERGPNNKLETQSASGEAFKASISAFNSNGFSLDASSLETNSAGPPSPGDYASWTFRKAKNFFDVVTYTGDGNAEQVVPHNLGANIGMVIIKQTAGGVDPSTSTAWGVWHKDAIMDLKGTIRSLHGMLDTTESFNNWGLFPIIAEDVETNFTDKHFTVAGSGHGNVSGAQYVAYVFAHDDSDESMIKCGSYTGNGSADGPEIDLGFEPQWVMLKSTTGSHGWIIHDTMRGWTADGKPIARLRADQANAEYNDANYTEIAVTPTGFRMTDTHASTNGSGEEYIYMAIRRPNKPAEEFDPDELFAVDIDNDPARHGFTTGFVTDMGFAKKITGSSESYLGSRPTAGKVLDPIDTIAEVSSPAYSFDQMDGFFKRSGIFTDYVGYGWRRAPGFFDVVTYKGDGTDARFVDHGLRVAPEMMWIKNRSNGSRNWVVHSSAIPGAPNNHHLNLNTAAEIYTPSLKFSSIYVPNQYTFCIQSDREVNALNDDYIAYLFASVPGISAIGTYTGDGSGYQVIYPDGLSGASIRFVLVKRVDGTGNWMMFDRERGTDAALSLNRTDAQKTGDFWSWTFGAFGVKNNNAHGPEWNPNTNGAEYLYYAITL